MSHIKNFVKREVVFCISFILAFVSCFFVTPDYQYINYIDFRTLSLLYCLMIVVAGFRKAGLFAYLSHILCTKAKNTRAISYILVFLCFFTSMIITNDVALLTFVPFAVVVLGMSHDEKNLIHVVVLQTIAANLGSMLTPVGNPQNLYLFSKFNLKIFEFILICFPVWIVSFLLIALLCFLVKKRPINVELGECADLEKKDLPVFSCLLLICLLVVFRVISWYWMLAIVFVSLLIYNKNVLKDADFILLLTFICFFIFSGNLARINSIDSFLRSFLSGHEYITALLLCQVISNVPAALILSSFTENYSALILGVDIGGLGTIVASLASLISLKLYSHSDNSSIGKYLIEFSILNLVLLIILSILFI